jgi:asparagine synthase (glutamine-hydrolysing)
MCGISGIVFQTDKDYKKHVNRMVKSLKHRGPDDDGILVFKNCILGHSRLSIVDLSTGNQPMLSVNKDRAITFNGEIYGYQDIKNELYNYRFKTNSDTEVILALYEKYGENLMPHLPGMFAFAIWDESEKKLFCARDRFGEKPFFYTFGANGEFIFASEIKAILVNGLVTPILSRKAIAHYLQRCYIHPHLTIYENIYVLPPAYTLRYQNEKLTIERYWALPKTDYFLDINEAVRIFADLLEKAVRSQLVADVPVGAFLSGGLDSTTIVALASRYKSDLKTFSFGFHGNLNELKYAKEAAKKYKTDHCELIEEKEVTGGLLVEMQNVYDEPLADSSNIPTYIICKKASQFGKVVLTGDGADELLAGYTWLYTPLLFMEKEFKFYLLKYILNYLVDRVFIRSRIARRNFAQYAKKGLLYRHKFHSIFEAHKEQNIYFSDSELEELGMEMKRANIINDLNRMYSNTVDDALRMDLETYMPGDILVKTDRASMAHGLELRAPFLDVKLAEFCISLPSRLKINHESDKLILRKAFSESWPSLIRYRGKQGFGSPLSEWLKQDSFRELKVRYLKNSKNKIYDIIAYDKSKCYIEKDNYQTWILLVLSMWMEKNVFDFCK